MKKNRKTNNDAVKTSSREYRSPDYDIVVVASDQKQATKLIKQKVKELQKTETENQNNYVKPN